MTFWVTTALIALAVTASLVAAMLRGRMRPAAQSRRTAPQSPEAEVSAASGRGSAFDIKVYRDQLAEVDRDLERGVISKDDAERTRTEVKRRILAADAAHRSADGTPAPQAPKTVNVLAAGLVAVGLIGGSLWIYRAMGAPGVEDLPRQARIAAAQTMRETRDTQAALEAALPPVPPMPLPERDAELMEALRNAVADRPDDLKGAQMLAGYEAAVGNFRAAYAAQQRVLSIKGDAANAEDYTTYGELLFIAAGNRVSPEAEAAFSAALARDRTNGGARFYMGVLMLQTGRPDVAFRTWRNLLSEGPVDAPWIAPIVSRIEEVAFLAGEDYSVPPIYTASAAGGAPADLKGPSAEDMEAASELDAEDRNAMVRGMVAQLSERLATSGGSPAEWAQLISAYGVLGEVDRARAIWTEAQSIFAAHPEALEEVRQGAARAGVAQ